MDRRLTFVLIHIQQLGAYRDVAGLTKAELVEQNSKLRAENDFLRKTRIAEGIIQAVLALIRWGAIVGIVYFFSEAMQGLAGSSTQAKLDLSLLANFNFSVTIAWISALAGIAYGLLQRHLRRNTVERLQGRVRELEQRIDPGRSSSKLTERGDTRPEDRL